MQRDSEYLLASSLPQSNASPPEGGEDRLGGSRDSSSFDESTLDLELSGEVNLAALEEYAQLQRSIFTTALVVTVLSFTLGALFVGIQFSISLLVGALSGLIYLRLLARNIGKLGKSSKTVSKVQLLVPVMLVLAISRLPQLDLLPALIGFILYKPSLALQVFFESRSRLSS